MYQFQSEVTVLLHIEILNNSHTIIAHLYLHLVLLGLQADLHYAFAAFGEGMFK